MPAESSAGTLNMSELPLVLSITAALLAFALGVATGRLLHKRPVTPVLPEDSDARTRILELQHESEASARELLTIKARADRQVEELARTREHIQNLEQQVVAYLRQYAQAKDMLKKEILQKSSLRAELAASHAESEALRGRVQELVMERTASASGIHRKQAN